METDINVAFVGDVHGSIIPMYEFLAELEHRAGIHIDGVVQVGDFGIYMPSDELIKHTSIQTARFEIRTNFPKLWKGEYAVPMPTWVCPGNHEDYRVLIHLIGADRHVIHNFHILEDGSINDVLGLRVGAIWGNYSYKSYRNPTVIEDARTYNTHSRKALHIYEPSVERLMKAGQFDVLVTHDAPKGLLPIVPVAMNSELKSTMGLDEDELYPGGCPGFLPLYETGQPDVHFFGHFHVNRVMRRTNPRVVCLHAFNYNAPASIEVRTYTVEQGEQVNAGTSVPSVQTH